MTKVTTATHRAADWREQTLKIDQASKCYRWTQRRRQSTGKKNPNTHPQPLLSLHFLQPTCCYWGLACVTATQKTDDDGGCGRGLCGSVCTRYKTDGWSFLRVTFSALPRKVISLRHNHQSLLGYFKRPIPSLVGHRNSSMCEIEGRKHNFFKWWRIYSEQKNRKVIKCQKRFKSPYHLTGRLWAMLGQFTAVWR